MIEEIGKMIAAILGLLKEGKIEQAQKLYSEGIKRSLDLDEEAILIKDTDQLRNIFEDKFGESFEGLEVMAGLLVQGGDIHVRNNDDERAKSCYIKALQLYNLVEIESGAFSLERQANMGKVNQLINQLKS
ncbi:MULTISPECIES: hypothetical protein [unclassified Saccharicrinis]|uniref:hypothetical protein n=1 Tax=unclassified Saccharicrinis TaxID=2646859 RepID=UPI003D326A50